MSCNKYSKYRYKYVQIGGGSLLDQYVKDILDKIDRRRQITTFGSSHRPYIQWGNDIILAATSDCIFFPEMSLNGHLIDYIEFKNMYNDGKIDLENMKNNGREFDEQEKEIVYYLIITAYLHTKVELEEKIGGIYEIIKEKVLSLSP